METALEKTEEPTIGIDPAVPSEDNTVINTLEKGYIVISGCPRSGTSLTMKIHQAMYGEDKILGFEFPQEQREKAYDEDMDEDVPEHAKSLRNYMKDKQEKIRATQMSAAERQYHDMNPGGFWECAFSVIGIFYQWHMRQELAAAREDWKIVKVVSQGLNNSDVEYINKIVFLLRHPRAVAKSQERLVRFMGVQGAEGEIHNLFDKFVIHTPEMFIEVTLQAMVFLLGNRDIPFLIVNYEDILNNPAETIKKIYDFNNVPGDLEEGIKKVDPKLNRSSKTDSIEHPMFEDANYIYEAMLDFKILIENGYTEKAYNRLKIALEYMQDPKRDYHKQTRQWRCFRAKEATDYGRCVECMTNPEVRAQLRAQSEAQHGSIAEYWKREPCLFECGLDPERKKYMTVEESVENNFFNHDEPLDLEKIRAEE
jgi:hypothetical protein